jgi:hypothetical protein
MFKWLRRKPRPKKEINFIYRDFMGNKIKGKLYLVDDLSLGSLFTSAEYYNNYCGIHQIPLAEANKNDVAISHANRQKYYIFLPSYSPKTNSL